MNPKKCKHKWEPTGVDTSEYGEDVEIHYSWCSQCGAIQEETRSEIEDVEDGIKIRLPAGILPK